MNLHEYQAKELMKKNGAAIQEGIVAETPEQAVAAAQKLKELYNSDWVVVKSQIHAGGRGKGKIAGTDQNGVALAKNHDAVKTIATDGYNAVQVGYGTRNAKNINKAQLGQMPARAGGKGGTYMFLREFRTENEPTFKVGDSIDLSSFSVGDKVTVSGISKGKGFQGVVKRHGFGGAASGFSNARCWTGWSS